MNPILVPRFQVRSLIDPELRALLDSGLARLEARWRPATGDRRPATGDRRPAGSFLAREQRQ